MLPYCFGTSDDVTNGLEATGEHWMLLVAEVPERRDFVLDPVPECTKYKQAARKLARHWM